MNSRIRNGWLMVALVTVAEVVCVALFLVGVMTDKVLLLLNLVLSFGALQLTGYDWIEIAKTRKEQKGSDAPAPQTGEPGEGGGGGCSPSGKRT